MLSGDEKGHSTTSQSSGVESLYAAPFPRDTVLSYILKSTQRSCLPSTFSNPPPADLPQTESLGRRESARNSRMSQISGNASTVDSANVDIGAQFLSMTGATAESAWSATPCRACTPVPQTKSRPRKKVTLSRRWRPYINGTVERYRVASRALVSVVEEKECPFNSLEEMARRRLIDSKAYRPTCIALPVKPTQLPPLVVQPCSEDLRVALERMEQAEAEEPHIPNNVMEKKLLFDATVGSVKPYALGGGSASRERRADDPKGQPIMPQSALTQDPLTVFVETMRYQRPTVGVFSFDVA